MTREEAIELLPIIKAFAEGKTIQSKQINASDKEWRDIEECNFLREHSYRIKPKYRPFKSQEECWNEMLKHQPFGWIRGNIKYYLISTLNDIGIWLGDKVSYTFRESIDNFTFADGTPFGIKEE